MSAGCAREEARGSTSERERPAACRSRFAEPSFLAVPPGRRDRCNAHTAELTASAKLHAQFLSCGPQITDMLLYAGVRIVANRVQSRGRRARRAARAASPFAGWSRTRTGWSLIRSTRERHCRPSARRGPAAPGEIPAEKARQLAFLEKLTAGSVARSQTSSCTPCNRGRLVRRQCPAAAARERIGRHAISWSEEHYDGTRTRVVALVMAGQASATSVRSSLCI